MAEKTTELERIYTIPLREARDLTRSKRANNAVRDVKRFLTRHMKTETIWVDASVNEALWANGKFTIPSKIRVRATRFSDGVVEVTLPEAAATGSVREALATRREKAAESPVLKAPTAEEGEEGEHKHEGSDRPVTDVKGIGPATAEKLEKAGIANLGDLAHADPKDLAEVLGGEDKAKGFIDDAHAILEGKTETADVKAQPALEAAKREAGEAAKPADAKPEGKAGEAKPKGEGKAGEGAGKGKPEKKE